MHTSVASLLAFAASTQAVYQGFNYGSLNPDQSPRTAAQFTEFFKAAQSLAGAPGFTSARLYTMIQGGTTADPISAIDAAIATNTTLLLGLWASGTGYANELKALKAAIDKYGSSLANLVTGISIGSEDMYRISPIGIAAKSGVGLGPEELVEYIKQARELVAGTPLASARFGHVDTSTAWVNGSNAAVIQAVDWIGMDAYPYFEDTKVNDIKSAKNLFETAIRETNAATGNKELLITETGWPTTGPNSNLAVASTDNAEKYWQEVGCALFGKVSTWWYILSETGAKIDFGVVDDPSKPNQPKFNLACKSTSGLDAPTPSGSSSGSSATGSVAIPNTNGTNSTTSPRPSTTTGSGSGSGSGSSPSGSSSSPTSTPHNGATVQFVSTGAAMVAAMVAMLSL